MIKTNDVIMAVRDTLNDGYPDRKVYLNRCPVNFVRPSFWIELVKRNMTDAAATTVKIDMELSVACYISPGHHGISDDMELTDMQDGVSELFSRGYIRVGDRALHACAGAGGLDPEADCSFVTVALSYFDDQPSEPDTTPVMEDVDMAVGPAEQ